MHNLITPRYRIGLCRDGAAIAKRTGRLRGGWTVVSLSRSEPGSSGLSHLGPLLAELAATHPVKGEFVTVTLHDELLRLFMVAPPVNTARPADYIAVAQLRFQEIYADAARDWYFDAAWRAAEPSVVCAAPKTVVDTVNALVPQQGLRLLEITSFFERGWLRCQRMLRDHDWFATMQGCSLVLCIVMNKAPAAVRSITIPPAATRDPGWLSMTLARESLRLGRPAPTRIVLYGRLPDGWARHAAASVEVMHEPVGQASADGAPVLAEAAELAVAGASL